jgi:hypothetical protein
MVHSRIEDAQAKHQVENSEAAAKEAALLIAQAKAFA